MNRLLQMVHEAIERLTRDGSEAAAVTRRVAAITDVRRPPELLNAEAAVLEAERILREAARGKRPR